ncbi:MAG TPA: diaminopimelate epimerase, partial [Bacilli bacterium]|nr:diaminopimelate epimerase [Bacilli bacterium]
TMKFAKYHGLGNDFIIIEDGPYDYSQLAVDLCDRHIGVGADGLIIVNREPLVMGFYNMDGSEGTMCGNGLRCFAQYCMDNGIVTADEFIVRTKAGLRKMQYLGNNLWQTSLGKPEFDPKLMDIATKAPQFINEPMLGVRVSAVFTGTTHAVVFVLNINSAEVSDLGERISNHSLFLKQTNVNFVQVLDRMNFSVRTYERGVGWTLACGTGAAAGFVMGHLKDYCDDAVNIHFALGHLHVQQTENGELLLTGPAEKICTGDFLKTKRLKRLI